MHDGERQAAVDPAAIDQNRTGAALAVIAALLGPGQANMLAQQVQHSGADVDIGVVGRAVDREVHRRRTLE